MRKRSFLAAMAATPLLPVLSACGGGGGGGDGNIRFVNASNAYPSLDLYVDSNKQFSAIASGKASDYAGIGDGSHTVSVRSAGGGTTLYSASPSVGKDTHYTFVAYGDSGELTLQQIIENDTAPDSGYAKLRIFNASNQTISAFITDVGGTLAGATSVITQNSDGTVGSITPGTNSPNAQPELAGKFRLFVTVGGDRNTVLLDIKSLTLEDQQNAVLIVTPGAGATLVNAVLLIETGDVTSFANTDARVRLVAGVTGDRSVKARIGSTVIPPGVGITAPAVGDYALVPSGKRALTVSVDGAQLSADDVTIEAGADYSVLVYGDVAPVVKLIADDNTLPDSTSETNIRFVHLSATQATRALTLKLNKSVTIANQVTYGGVSAYTSTAVSSDASGNEFIVSLGTTTVDDIATVQLSTAAVYTVFLLGDAYGVVTRDDAN